MKQVTDEDGNVWTVPGDGQSNEAHDKMFPPKPPFDDGEPEEDPTAELQRIHQDKARRAREKAGWRNPKL